MLGLDHQHEVVVERTLQVEVDDVGARDHQRAEQAFVEAEDVAHHLVFLALDHASLGAFFQQGADFLFGEDRGGLLAFAHHPQQAVGGQRQQHDEGAGQPRQQADRARYRTCDALRMELRQALGNQFADDDRDIGDDDHHQCGGADEADVLVQPQRLQPDDQRCGESGLADDAAEDADRGDADLHRRQVARRRVAEFDGDRRGLVAFVGQASQPRAACSREGELGHREQPVEHDQEKKEEDFHGRRGRQRGDLAA